MDFVTCLPLDVVRYTLVQFLDIKTIANTASVCKSWAKLQSDELLWKDLLKRDWNVEKEEVDGEEKEQLSWRELYRHYYEMKFLIITSESTYLRDVKLHIVEGGIRPQQIDLINVRMMQWVYDNSVQPLKSTNDQLNLQLLKRYKAVFYFGCSSAFPCPSTPSFTAVTMGNLLAQYADEGGAVLSAVFANCSTCSGVLKGKWKDEQYDPLVTSVQAERHLPGIIIPKHPIFAGVHSFTGGTSGYYCTGTIKPNARTIAEYNENNTPFVVESTEHKIVTLNFFPPSSKTRTDFWKSEPNSAGRIMANSLNYIVKMKPVNSPLLSSATASSMLAGSRATRPTPSH